MKMRVTFLFLLLCVFLLKSTELLSQDDIKAKALSFEKKGDAAFEAQDYPTARELYEKAGEIYLNNQLYKEALVDYNGMCYVFFMERKYEELLEFAEEVVKKITAQEPTYLSNELAELFNYKGLAYYKQSDWTNSYKAYQKTLSIWHAIGTPVQQNVLWDINRVCYARGDYAAAASYIKQYKKCFSATHYFKLYDAEMQLAKIYTKNNQFHLALAACDRASKAIKSTKPHTEKALRILVVTEKRAFVYALQKDYRKAIKMMNTLLTTTNYNPEGCTHNLGVFYLKQGNIDSARYYLQRSLALQDKYKNEKSNIDLGVTHTVLAELYIKTKEFEIALKHAQNGLKYFLFKFQDNDIKINPALEDMAYEHDLRKALHYKATALVKLGLENENEELYRFGLETYDLLIQLLAKMRTSYEVQGSKINLAQDTWKVFENAIDDAMLLYNKTQEPFYLEIAWKYSEQSKSELLQDALAEVKAQHELGVDPGLIKQEHDLKIQLELVAGAIQKIKNQSAKLAELEQKQVSLQAELNELKKQLAIKHPNYHQLQYERALPRLSDVQEQLSDDRAIIQYFVGNYSLYAFVISKNNINVLKSSYTPTFFEQVEKMRKGLAPSLVEADPEKSHELYTQNAALLYESVLKPSLESLPSSITKLTIVPDGELSYIPFEVLLTDRVPATNKNYKGMPYLMRKYQINYAYASSFKQVIPKLYGKPKYEGVLAFAPSYASVDIASNSTVTLSRALRDQLGDLVWNSKEIEALDQVMSTDLFKDAQATEQVFKEKAADYQILHLAMHALVDDEQSMQSKLVFTTTPTEQEDGFLHLYELYNMQLKADLVVLSACNTGYGEYIRGEGIVSLGRAFTYAGCPNVVISHWSVDDQSTSKLMAYFYQELADGKSKGQALQEAKMNYLTSAQPRDAHPAFWGSFVLNGNDVPIESGTNYLPILISLLVLGIVILFFVVRKK